MVFERELPAKRVQVLERGRQPLRTGRLAVVVVFDEGETTEQVPFVLMAPGLSGVKISEAANQYALTRLIDTVIGAPPLRQAGSATDVASLLGAAR